MRKHQRQSTMREQPRFRAGLPAPVIEPVAATIRRWVSPKSARMLGDKLFKALGL